MSQPPRGRGAAGPPPAPPAQAARGGRARGPVAGVPFGGVDPLYVVGTDGFLRVLRTSDGTDAEPGVPFLPPGAMASALVFIDGAVYTTTSNGCGASPNGVWMIDTTTPDHAVTSWRTGGPNIVGTSGLAFGTDGTVFVAVGSAPASSDSRPSAASTQFADSIVALDASTLTVKDWFSAPGARFNTSPMVVRHDNRDLVFAAADDGRLYVLDGASLGGANHSLPLHSHAGLQRCGRRRLAGDVGIAGHALDSGAGRRCAKAGTRLRSQWTFRRRTDRGVQTVGNRRNGDARARLGITERALAAWSDCRQRRRFRGRERQSIDPRRAVRARRRHRP